MGCRGLKALICMVMEVETLDSIRAYAGRNGDPFGKMTVLYMFTRIHFSINIITTRITENKTVHHSLSKSQLSNQIQ